MMRNYVFLYRMEIATTLRVYSQPKQSDVSQLNNIIAQSTEKPHIVYKNQQGNDFL